MAMNIKDQETERLVTQLARCTGQSKTAAVREAVRDQLARLTAQETVEEREKRFRRFLEEEIWPHVPADQLGKQLTKEEEEDILGYGPGGV